MKQYGPIYKTDSKGNLRVWYAEVINVIGDGLVRTTTGLVSGKQKTAERMVLTNKKQCGFDSACQKTATKMKNNLKTGYFKTVDEARSEEKPLMPMMAKTLAPEDISQLPRDYFPCIIQEKLNGVRATYHHDRKVLLSRNLKPFDKHPELVDSLGILCDDLGYQYLDMELYIPGQPINEIVSAVKKGKPVVAYIFDIPSDLSGHARTAQLSEVTAATMRHGLMGQVKTVGSQIVSTHEQVRNRFDFITETIKGEGLIIRHIGKGYEWNNKNTRSDVLYKVKPTESAEFKVVAIGCEKRMHEGRTWNLIEFVCETDKGLTFKVTPSSWGLEKRESAWLDFLRVSKEDRQAYIDSLAPLTLEFREYTSTGKPFHILEVISRDYE